VLRHKGQPSESFSVAAPLIERRPTSTRGLATARFRAALVDLEQMAGSQLQKNLGADKRNSLPRMCRECDVQFARNGECPKHRFITTPDGESGQSYLCAVYKDFFHHIDPCLQFMAAELRACRPPANIMRIMGSSS
jgi:radical SAM protein with 4Fe4S-binding SPASM domain